MDEKQKKPKRKQITVSPETKKKLDAAYGEHVREWGYISLGEFCDMLISYAVMFPYEHIEEDERSDYSSPNGENRP